MLITPQPESALNRVAQALCGAGAGAGQAAEQALQRALDTVREIFSVDVAAALVWADPQTALALASSPPGAVPDGITHPAIFGAALDDVQPQYRSGQATPAQLPQRLRGATAVWPWVGGDVRGATVLVRRQGPDFSGHEAQALGAIAPLLQTAAWLCRTSHNLAQEKGRFDAIVSHVPHALVHVDAAGLGSWVNDRAGALLGLPPGPVAPACLATAMASFWQQAQAPEFAASVALRLAQPGATLHDGVLVLAGSPQQVYSVSSVPTQAPQAQGRLWAFTDITAQHNALQEIEQHNAQLLEASASALRASAAKDDFLATMGHEIRTPMNGLLGMLELLELTPLNPDQLECLSVARESGTALARILDDVVDHAKLAAGRLPICPEPVSIKAMLESLVNQHQAQAGAKGLSLLLAVDPRMAPALQADPVRLQQVLSNLLSNAIKFTHDGYVELRADVLARGSEAQTLELTVKDTGVGMSEAVQAGLFKPFEATGVNSTRMSGSTGLGLAISQRLIEMMSGQMTLVSALGVGTTVCLRLRLAHSKGPISDDVEKVER